MSAPNGVDQRFARFVERIEHADSRSVACLRRGFVFIEKGIVRVLDLVKGSASGYLKDFVRIHVCWRIVAKTCVLGGKRASFALLLTCRLFKGKHSHEGFLGYLYASDHLHARLTFLLLF